MLSVLCLFPSAVLALDQRVVNCLSDALQFSDAKIKIQEENHDLFGTAVLLARSTKILRESPCARRRLP